MGGSTGAISEVGYVLKRLRPTMPAFDTLKEES
ncbi:MAG: GNAT family N-acetyltransferase, partial [Mesorhizobium sp.]